MGKGTKVREREEIRRNMKKRMRKKDRNFANGKGKELGEVEPGKRHKMYYIYLLTPIINVIIMYYEHILI